jgi:hypothetical protein
MKSHSNEKYKYECDVCNEKFKGKMQLNQHMKTHQDADNDDEINEADLCDDDDSTMPIDHDQESLSSGNFKDNEVESSKQTSEQVAESKKNLRKSKYPRKVKIDFKMESKK